MVLENNKDNCASLINEVVYDVSGFRERNLFTITDQDEMNFVYSFYKSFSDMDENNVKEIIKKLLKNSSKLFFSVKNSKYFDIMIKVDINIKSFCLLLLWVIL